VGWVRGSEILELAAVDAEQGGMFYTFDADKGRVPQLDQGQCLICHASLRTQGVPGFFVRSVICNPAGRFVSGSPSYVTDHSSPFQERWGGWYVTGTHGSLKHLGNVVCEDEDRAGWLDPEAGQNLQQLPACVASDAYLGQGSDLVALMVLEHQAQMHNLITRAAYEARTAAHQDAGINEALGRPSDYVTESTGRRIAAVSEKLVRYLLFADEYPLSEGVAGTSRFATEFSQRGPHDEKARSLYQLDLHQRLMKYPCSYLIYSPAFDALPEAVQREAGGRLKKILLEPREDDGFPRLTRTDRAVIAEILAETKQNFWQRYVVGS
jgi:hypothetical protein